VLESPCSPCAPSHVRVSGRSSHRPRWRRTASTRAFSRCLISERVRRKEKPRGRPEETKESFQA
jgi:hypothetical protein